MGGSFIFFATMLTICLFVFISFFLSPFHLTVLQKQGQPLV